MNWLQRTGQNMGGSTLSVSDILNQSLMNQLPLRGPNGALEQISMTAGASACEEVQAFGEISSEANSIASTIMRGLGCDGYPNAPGAQQQQQQQMLTPDAFPALGEQEKPMSMPSAEIV